MVDDIAAGERYLLLADISGYTSFLAGVEQEHGLDFSGGIPAAYGILAALLGTVIEGVAPGFELVKLEGDAVFAAAPAERLDGQGEKVVEMIGATYREFIGARTRAIPSHDHICSACPNVARLDLKFVLHRGPAVRQSVGAGSDLLGPSVTVAHRLLKNTVRHRIGPKAYLFVSSAAAMGLGLSGVGIGHVEEYADAGRIEGRIIELEVMPSQEMASS